MTQYACKEMMDKTSVALNDTFGLHWWMNSLSNDTFRLVVSCYDIRISQIYDVVANRINPCTVLIGTAGLCDAKHLNLKGQGN